MTLYEIINLTDSTNIQDSVKDFDNIDLLMTSYIINKADISSLLELGYYYYEQDEDLEKSLNYFEKGLEVLNNQRIDFLCGKIKCLVDMEQREEAKKLYNKSIEEFGKVEKLAKCLRDLELVHDFIVS